MSLADKKVPFKGLNATDLPAAGGNLVSLATIPAGKSMFMTRVVATGTKADNLVIADQVAGGAIDPANTLIPDIRVGASETVVVDLGDEGVPVTTEISATSTTAADALLAYDVMVEGYYL
jgi:hypothetical protein